VASPDLWKILIACIGFGAGGEALRQYRAFKRRRRAISRGVRNSGFWTDKKLFQAEALASAMALAVPFCAIIPLITAGRDNWWLYSYPALVVYAGAIYLLMRGVNMDEPQ